MDGKANKTKVLLMKMSAQRHHSNKPLLWIGHATKWQHAMVIARYARQDVGAPVVAGCARRWVATDLMEQAIPADIVAPDKSGAG